MIPGEVIVAKGEIELNAGRPSLVLSVANTGDRPVFSTWAPRPQMIALPARLAVTIASTTSLKSLAARSAGSDAIRPVRPEPAWYGVANCARPMMPAAPPLFSYCTESAAFASIIALPSARPVVSQPPAGLAGISILIESGNAV